MPERIIMQPAEDILIDMDFSGVLRSGDDIASVDSVSATPAGATPGATSFSGQVAQVRFTGPSAGDYVVTITVTSAAGDTRQGEGYLKVEDLP